MNFKINAVLAAVAALAAAGSAQAAFSYGNASTGGSSSAAFVAIDNAGSVSLAVDLGTSFSSFLSDPSLTLAAGSLSAAGTVAQWNFASNTFSVNGQAQAGTYNWSGIVSNYLGQVGGSYKWGVVGGDAVSGNTTSASNVVAGNNILFTTAAPDFDNSLDTGTTPGSIANAGGNINNFFASSNMLTGANTTHGTSTGVHGANIATSGQAFLGMTMAQDGGSGPAGQFGVQLGLNDYLNNPGDVSMFLWANQGPGSGALARLYEIGTPNNLGDVSAAPATWAWDESTSTLTYTVTAVPEPGTYAMLLAGLGAIGMVVRRRTQG